MNLDNQVCVIRKPAVANCLQYAHIGYCGKCASGYYVSKGTCVKKDTTGCKAYGNSRCMLCNMGYNLGNDGVCVKSTTSETEISEI